MDSEGTCLLNKKQKAMHNSNMTKVDYYINCINGNNSHHVLQLPVPIVLVFSKGNKNQNKKELVEK